jgi:uncharacterized RDD family membrane protein YckC
MTEVDKQGGVSPRYFWRRALALLLDAILATLIIALVFGAIRAATGVDLGMSSLATYSQSKCDLAQANHPQTMRVEGMWPLVVGESRQNILCQSSINGREQPLQFVTRVTRKDGAKTFTREARYPVNGKGQPIPIDYPLDWSAVAYLLIFVVLTAGGRRTPGKTFLGLRVVTEAGSGLSWTAALARETLKFVPCVAYFVVSLWVAFSPPAILSDSQAIIIAIRDGTAFTSPCMIFFVTLGVATLFWWLGPFLLWRGRTWYDALTGTRLVRTDRPVSRAPRQA